MSWACTRTLIRFFLNSLNHIHSKTILTQKIVSSQYLLSHSLSPQQQQKTPSLSCRMRHEHEIVNCVQRTWIDIVTATKVTLLLPEVRGCVQRGMPIRITIVVGISNSINWAIEKMSSSSNNNNWDRYKQSQQHEIDNLISCVVIFEGIE